MAVNLRKKMNCYEGMLASALDEAMQAVSDEMCLGATAADCLKMAESYLGDGRHFRADDDWVNVLASSSYGYGWLDAGVRMGLFDIPDDSHPFTM